MQLTQAQIDFMRWVKDNEPTVYALAAKRHALKTGGKEIYGLSGYEGGLHGMEDFFSTLTDTLTKVVPAVIQYKSQTKILDTQLSRARMGLPPLNVQAYSPVMRVSPSFDPDSEAALTRMAMQTTSSGISQLLPVILLGLGAFVFLKMRGTKRR